MMQSSKGASAVEGLVTAVVNDASCLLTKPSRYLAREELREDNAAFSSDWRSFGRAETRRSDEEPKLLFCSILIACRTLAGFSFEFKPITAWTID